MPYKYPVWYGDHDRETRNEEVFYASISGLLSLMLLAGSVGLLFFSTELYAHLTGGIFAIGGFVFGWLTTLPLKAALAAHKRHRERVLGWKRS